MARHLSFIMLGIILVFSCTDAWALSDKDHTRFLKTSPAYADANRRLNEVWRELKTTLPKEDYSRLLEEQRAWVKNGRDREAAVAGSGLSGADAYAATTMKRADVLAQRYGLRQAPQTAATREPAAASVQRAAPPQNGAPVLAATPGATPAFSASKQVTLTGTVETFREAAMWWARLHTGQDESTHIGALGEIPEGARECLREAEDKKQTVTVRAIADAKGFIDGQSVECIAANAGKQNNRAPQTHRNSIGMDFVRIPAGSFMMGVPNPEKQHKNEMPLHKVTITRPFYLGKYEVTQAQWVAVMGSNPSRFKGRNNPVERVSWSGAQEFIRRLNQKEGHNYYRLPTEAEWEYAARAGTSSAYFFGDDKNKLSEHAWYSKNSKYSTYNFGIGYTTHPVGQKPANPWGLHDVHGNVFEWVQDEYTRSGFVYYNPATGSNDYMPYITQGIRGCGYFSPAESCRSGDRAGKPANDRAGDVGFRLALSPDAVQSAQAQNTQLAAAVTLNAPSSPLNTSREPAGISNSIGMKFVLIPAGSFMMGIDPIFEEGDSDEMPQHNVTITRPFYLGKYEVTQAEWTAVMGDNPSDSKGPNKPVEQVSWDDAQEFIQRLNQKEGHNRYRLPTEAEWEYAARAGTNSAYSFGDDKTALSGYAWYGNNSGFTTHPVGQKPANPWGLHDVHGNVNEWVQDWYGKTYYANRPETDPKGPIKDPNSNRVRRGGSWNTDAEFCRSGNRYGYTLDERRYDVGFRLALSPE